MFDYKLKYLKYKLKYRNLKKLVGGSRQIKIYYTHDKTELTEFMVIDFDESDDIETVKNQIIQKINKPEYNTANVVLRAHHKNHCKPTELKSIGNDVTALCFSLKNTIDSSLLIPISIKSGESSDPFVNGQKTLSTVIPRPQISLLRPRILQAIEIFEKSGRQYISWDNQIDPNKLIKLDLPNTDNTSSEFSPNNFLNMASENNSFLSSPPPAPRLEKSTYNAKNERIDIIDQIINSEPYAIFDVRIDTDSNEYKFWVKNSSNDLLEVIVTLKGKVNSIINKGPVTNTRKVLL